MQVMSVDDEWINQTSKAVRTMGANVLGLALEYRRRKVLIGRDAHGRWHAFIEFEDDDGEMCSREEIAPTPEAALSGLIARCDDIVTDFS